MSDIITGYGKETGKIQRPWCSGSDQQHFSQREDRDNRQGKQK